MPPKQMQGQLITTSRTHWVLCVDYSEVPHVGEVFHSPQSVLSSLVSSYQQPAEVGSAPEGSTVQLSPSAEREEDSVRGRRCEDKHRVTAPPLRSSSSFFHVSPGTSHF